MGASITLAGENLIAQKQGAQQILTVSRFILANVPGLDPNGPVDRAAGKPAAGQIVGTYDVTQAGYVNPNQVVYSLMMGSDIGDFDWNWIGLETSENVLLMVAYVPTQQKRRNIPPLQLGNNVTRNFLVVFDGAQALTGLTIDASTWQHDFTVRLAGIDERERQSNRDIFGRACFFGSALQLEKVGAVYQLKPGTAYVEGVRLQRFAALPVVPPAFPTTAWLDVALQRELNDVVASWSVVWGAGKVDYVDSAGVQHYCVAIADLPNSNTITDSRPVENIAGPLVTHFAARVGDYAGLRARSTTKNDVGLGNLPNAKSDSKDSNSSEELATTKMVQAVRATVLKVGGPSLQHPIIAAQSVGNTYQHTAMEIREALADASGTQTEDHAPAIGWHWGGILGIRQWMNAAGELMWGGSTFHHSGNGASQAEAEAGIGTTRWMSALRVVQTLRSAAAAATETLRGVLRVATQAEVNAGSEDSLAVTPKKLRAGFAINLGINGFIAFPTWMGGFMLQWGRLTINQSGVNVTSAANWTYPTPFPNTCLSVWGFQHALGGSSGVSLLERFCGGGEPGASAVTYLISDADSGGAYVIRCFAIGY